MPSEAGFSSRKSGVVHCAAIAQDKTRRFFFNERSDIVPFDANSVLTYHEARSPDASESEDLGATHIKGPFLTGIRRADGRAVTLDLRLVDSANVRNAAL